MRLSPMLWVGPLAVRRSWGKCEGHFGRFAGGMAVFLRIDHDGRFGRRLVDMNAHAQALARHRSLEQIVILGEHAQRRDLRAQFELEVPRVLGLVLGDGLDTLRELGGNLFGILQRNRIGLRVPRHEVPHVGRGDPLEFVYNGVGVYEATLHVGDHLRGDVRTKFY